MMDGETRDLHFVFIPLMAQGHLIPMIDMAKLFAERGVVVTLVTTPHNASRIEHTVRRATRAGLPIRLHLIPFPCHEVGLPKGCENLDTLPSRNFIRNFYRALDMLEEPLEQYLLHQKPAPSCIISDKYLYWTSTTASKFKIPRIVFHGMGCFWLLSSHNIELHNARNSVSSDTESFVVPGMPQKVQATRSQLPRQLPGLDDFRVKIREAELSAYGVVVNSFEELEHGCAAEYAKAINKKIWCVGPVSVCNKEDTDKFGRGNENSISQKQCLTWLNSKNPKSVIYACLGSLCRLVPSQLIELGLALEGSNRPFIWVVKTGENLPALEKWLVEESFEERVKERGLVIKGWAPQVLILSHWAIGGFVTHCGWNSTMEGVCSGLPMITWPLFSEQFFNEKFIVEILKIGVPVGAEAPVTFGDENKVGVLVTRERIKEAIEAVMDGGEEGLRRIERASELGDMARKSTEKGGSSYVNIGSLIKDVLVQNMNSSTETQFAKLP